MAHAFGRNAMVGEKNRSTSPSLPYREILRKHTSGSTAHQESLNEIRRELESETFAACTAVQARSRVDSGRGPERHRSLPARCDFALFDTEDDDTGGTDTLAAHATVRRGAHLRKIRVAPPTSFAHREENQPAVDDADLPRILVDGFVLANRYILKGDRVDGRRMGRLADDRFTGQIVFLKFYPRFSTIYRHAARMHRRLQNSQAVCELIEILPNSNGLPPCLVFQAGSFTLARRLEKRALSATEQQVFLRSILQMLCDVHGQKIVHGHVDVHHIMWFGTDFCWKLVDLDTASAVGDPVPHHRITSRRHTAPEIQNAMDSDSKDTPSDTSSDMWSVGMVAFQIMTGTSAFDATCVKNYMTRERLWIEQGRNDLALDFGSDQRCAKSAKQRLQEFEFILQLIAESPAKRITASQALEMAHFDQAPKQKTPEKALADFLSGRGSLDGVDHGFSQWAICQAASCHLVVSIAIERFARDQDPKAAFQEKSTIKMKHISARRLSNHPVYVLTVGEAFCVRIRIGRDNRLCLPFKAITSMTVTPPDSAAVVLDLWQSNLGDTLEALAFVDPSRIPSERLNRHCPFFASTDMQYVKLEFHVKVRLGGDFPYDLDLFPIAYLRLKRRRGCRKSLSRG